MTTNALENFLHSLEHTPVQQDTYDLEHLAAVSPAERAIAEDLLMQRVRQNHDRQAINSLAALGVTRAIPLLQDISQDPASTAAVWASLALAQLGVDVTARLARDSQCARTFPTRFAIAHALRNHRGPQVIEALLSRLDDPVATLRSEAYASLLDVLELTPLVRTAEGQPEFHAPLERIHLLVASTLSSLARLGVTEFRRIVAELVEGKTVLELDLPYRPSESAGFGESLARSVSDGTTALPIDRVRAATGHDRAWAETFLVAQLALGGSRSRVPAAIAELGLTWALDALREARHLHEEDDVFAADLDAAISRLSIGATPT